MTITRDNLEEKQIWIYAATVIFAVIIGLLFKNGDQITILIEPVIGILLYSMFCQIPFLKLRKVFSNINFFKALLLANFIIIPILVWLLTLIFVTDSIILLGVFLVLLTPCIDYVIVFTHMGKGDSESILAATPLLFILQMVLLPFYLFLFIGKDSLAVIEPQPFIKAFVYLILIPFTLALLTQLSAKEKKTGKSVLQFSGWLPVPFMAMTLFIVIVSQIPLLVNNPSEIILVLPIYLLFSISAPFAGLTASKIFGLDPVSSRTVSFSASTRNSLVVLPLALALPASISHVVASVIVTQTMVELVFELIYIKVIPLLISNKNN